MVNGRGLKVDINQSKVYEKQSDGRGSKVNCRESKIKEKSKTDDEEQGTRNLFALQGGVLCAILGIVESLCLSERMNTNKYS